jgi:hypothetical protein
MHANICLSTGSIAEQVMALEQDQHAAEVHADKDLAEIDTIEAQRQHQEQQSALEQARQEAENASKWGTVIDIAKDVAAVGAVAAAAFTGGSSLVVAAALLGGAGTIGADIAKRTGLISDKAATWIELGSSLLSGGAGVGQLVGAGGAEVAATETAAVVKTAGSGTAAVATGTEGVATYGKDHALSDETSAQADAAQADNHAAEAWDRFDDAVDAIRHSNASAAQISVLAAELEAADSELSTRLISTLRG